MRLSVKSTNFAPGAVGRCLIPKNECTLGAMARSLGHTARRMINWRMEGKSEKSLLRDMHQLNLDVEKASCIFARELNVVASPIKFSIL